MQEPNKFDKLDAQEIHLGGAKRPKREVKHGKLYNWFDNFWYHHKWKTIISLFLIIVILVCTLQMCSREKTDISITLVGPYNFTDNESGYKMLQLALSSYCEDYNGDGDASVEIVHYSIYSKEEILEAQNHKDENGESAPIYINTAENTHNHEMYEKYMMTGDSSVLFLAPWLFEELFAKNEDFVVNLESKLGTVPEGAVYVTNKDGKQILGGVRLGDTELYRNNAFVREVLSADTVIVLTQKTWFGSERAYKNAVSYIESLIGIQ